MSQTGAATNKKIAHYTRKTKFISKLQRKAETRTKIQLGGLLIKSGLADLFSITVGADLQMDIEEREKATLLLGALMDIAQHISLNEANKEEWLHLGRSAFVDHFLSAKQNTTLINIGAPSKE